MFFFCSGFGLLSFKVTYFVFLADRARKEFQKQARQAALEEAQRELAGSILVVGFCALLIR